MKNHTVDINHLQQALKYIHNVNMLNIADIKWVDGCREIIPKFDENIENMEDFKMTGLNNIDFARGFVLNQVRHEQ